MSAMGGPKVPNSVREEDSAPTCEGGICHKFLVGEGDVHWYWTSQEALILPDHEKGPEVLVDGHLFVPCKWESFPVLPLDDWEEMESA